MGSGFRPESEVRRKRFRPAALVNHPLMQTGINGRGANPEIAAYRVVVARYRLLEGGKSSRLAKPELKARPVFRGNREPMDVPRTNRVTDWLKSRAQASILLEIVSDFPVHARLLWS